MLTPRLHLHRSHRTHWWAPSSLALVLALGFVPGAACADAGDGAEPTDDWEAFCQLAPRPDEEVPASYVGSGEHVGRLDLLVAAAPPEVVEELTRFRDFVASEVDPDDHTTQLTSSWPTEIQDDVATITASIGATCL